MDLVILVLILCVVGFLIWLLTTKIPMPAYWATAIQVIAVICLVLFVLRRFVHLPNVLP